jgi:putative addiction module component (TIGR02574 family)
MTATLAELEQRAIQLSAKERAQLALSLLQSLEPSDEGDTGETWRLESERRLTDIEDGKVQSLPGDEVIARVRRRLE